MKKSLVFLFAVLISWTLMGQENSYTMFETIYMTPKSGAMEDLKTNLGKHNKAFHADLPFRTSIYTIINGKNMGKILWVMGPTTYTQHDNRPSGGDHDEDWNNVSPYLDTESDGIGSEYWRMDEDLSHFPGSFQLAKQRVWIIDLKNGESSRFVEIMKKIKKVLVETEDPDAMGIYWNTLGGMGNDRDVGIVWFFDKWSWLDERSNFSKKYEEEHGAGTWRYFLDEWENCVGGFDVELRVFNKEMSGWDGNYILPEE